MASDPKVYVFDEVAKHNHKRDCWIIVSGKVYNVTPFMEEHPGGDEILLLVAEKDATEDFEDVGHSATARDLMKEFYVGEVDMSTVPKGINYRAPADTAGAAAPPPAQSSDLFIKALQFFVPLLILGVAFYLQIYGKKE